MNTIPSPDPAPPPSGDAETAVKPPRKRGAQPGNQNARKRRPSDNALFYTAALPGNLPQELRQAFVDSISRKDVMPEITLLRMSIMGLLNSEKASPERVIQMVRHLASLLRDERAGRSRPVKLPPGWRRLTLLAQEEFLTPKGLPQRVHQLLELGETKDNE